jgi:hypothetical protein
MAATIAICTCQTTFTAISPSGEAASVIDYKTIIMAHRRWPELRTLDGTLGPGVIIFGDGVIDFGRRQR